jgi:hypothetical protein
MHKKLSYAWFVCKLEPCVNHGIKLDLYTFQCNKGKNYRRKCYFVMDKMN